MPAPPPKAPADPKAAQDASGRARSAGDALAEECAALEEEVEELKVKYEMYFLGVELREPAKWREELKRKVLRIKEQFTRNTGLRFRLQSLHARFLSYERLWLRGAREREDGTYRRDLFKARRHQRGAQGAAAGAPGAAAARQGRPARGQAGAQGPHEAEDVDLSDFGGESESGQAASPTTSAAPAGPGAAADPAAAAAAAERAPASTQPDRLAAPVLPPVRPLEPAPRPAAGPDAAPRGQPVPVQRPAAAATAARPPERPAATAAGGLGDAQLRELYDAYVSAKRRCNEDTSRITFDAVASTVSRQVPEIMKQHKARAVEFKVVIKDGRAKLVAVPKG